MPGSKGWRKIAQPFLLISRAFRYVVTQSTRHPLGLVGLNLVTFSAIFFVFLSLLNILGVELNPYVGIIGFLILPALFILGLVLVPIGVARARRASAARGRTLFPLLDLNLPEHRQRLTVILILSAVNMLILGSGGFQAVHYMDSAEFCGMVCHTVMKPEYAAYQSSPHARVSCVDCHIGPGADWFVKSKLSGVRQVFAVALDTYHRPLPNPVRNLRPARETCEECHWPDKFVGDRVRVKKRYLTDRDNTEVNTILLLKVGGGHPESGFADGIHWHVSPTNQIEYLADSTRTEIYWIKQTGDGGEVIEYVKEGLDFDPLERPGLERRLMDCMDCHNRPTHAFHLPDYEIDRALSSGAISRELPFIRREAERLLTDDYPDHETAKREMARELETFYREQEPGQDEAAVQQAIEVIQAIYSRNVFPEMKVGWGTYPNHIGHEEFPGCFRCHDEEHVSAEGETVSQECTNCHHLLAIEERDPTILEQLYAE